MLTKKQVNELTYDVLGACIEVHKQMGGGLLESVYHECLIEELLYRKQCRLVSVWFVGHEPLQFAMLRVSRSILIS